MFLKEYSGPLSIILIIKLCASLWNPNDLQVIINYYYYYYYYLAGVKVTCVVRYKCTSGLQNTAATPPCN